MTTRTRLMKTMRNPARKARHRKSRAYRQMRQMNELRFLRANGIDPGLVIYDEVSGPPAEPRPKYAEGDCRRNPGWQRRPGRRMLRDALTEKIIRRNIGKRVTPGEVHAEVDAALEAEKL